MNRSKLTFKSILPTYNKIGRVLKHFEDKNLYKTGEYATALHIKNLIDKNRLQEAMDVYRKCSQQYNYFNRF